MTGTGRYARHTMLPEVGAAGQARLARARILLVGLGGLGCPAAEYLAASGVGELLLNDFDRVDESNLPRQILFGPQDVGRLKVDAAAQRLAALNPDVVLRSDSRRLTAAELAAVITGIDVVLDGSDNFATRLRVNAACVSARVPLVSGAAARYEGQLAVFPNQPGGACYRCIYDDADDWIGDCQGNGVLAPVPGVIGTLMAVETLKLLLGFDPGPGNRLLLWDARRADWQQIALRPKPGCPVCGTAPGHDG